MSHITAGLEYIHAQFEVHGGITPTNSTIYSAIRCIEHLVLYSAAKHLWKLADFGLASEGQASTDNEGIITEHGRGTSGYRAPELLAEQFQYTNKVDIWALGCISYELVTRKKLYKSDWELFVHVNNGSSFEMPSLVHLGQKGEFWQRTITQMLEVDPSKRPSAYLLHRKFTANWIDPEPRHTPHSTPLRSCSLC
jgi:serine/threonine protein kinase